jgi:osmotically-inducible protein OsmY
MLSEEQRTLDTELRFAVIQALETDEHTAPLNLRVGVLNGIVHLAGQAPSLDTWNLAEQLAACISGVRGVVNRIEAPGAPSPIRTINLELDN